MVTEVGVPVVLWRMPGLVTVTLVATAQVNVVVAGSRFASVTVMVTEPVPIVLGVPVITPVVGLMDRPVGRPVADQVYGAVPPAAVTGWVTAAPTVLLRVPGFVTAGAAATSQVNAVVPAMRTASVAVTVTVAVPAVVAVPEMTPVVGLMDSPAGRPMAAHV